MRLAPLFAAAAAILAAPALADNHGEGPALEEVLAMDLRSEDSARDRYRHPAETLRFFGVEPSMRVVEFGPGGGWYTRVLLPWIAPHGEYMAMQADTGPGEPGQPSWAERFIAASTAGGAFDADDITAFESDEIPEDLLGTVDRVLVFRSIHGLMNANAADRELRAIRSLLADDGLVGVVQHRAPEEAAYEYANGANGYMRQADVIRLFAIHGFDLVAASEINANPDDPANWEGGVWTLPPVLRYGEEDRERYEAIGESDRMTLLFRKAN